MTDFHHLVSKLGSVNTTVFYLITGQEPFEVFSDAMFDWMCSKDDEFRNTVREKVFKVMMGLSSGKEFTLAFYRSLQWMKYDFTEEQLAELMTKMGTLAASVPDSWKDAVRRELNEEIDDYTEEERAIQELVYRSSMSWMEADWFTDEHPEQEFVRVFNQSPLGEYHAVGGLVSDEFPDFYYHGKHDWFDIGITDDGMMVIREWPVYSTDGEYSSSMLVMRKS